MNIVVRGRFDAENLAIQLLTDTASYITHQQIQSISDDYHQNKQASHGRGHITQTTIEQQWETQLINDAEMTANTQLPSVRFDVNDAYISEQLGQRVGEEVSRFYHPTPPLPRNTNGFWERIEQRYKNNFERQALIAEGRAAANSEVMRESFGQAAANQQHYLDLGYSESVAQTRAAEWAAATELPLPPVAKGIMQASRLANRWGFFRSNDIENSRLISNVERVSSNIVNKDFINEDAIASGWKQPYPDNVSLRKITTAQEIKLYRVHVDPDRVAGRFLAREKEIAPFLNDPEALRLHLGLPDVPIYITEVNVPANTDLLVGRIGPQPSFGLIDKSGFQYQTIEKLPLSSTNTRLIIEPNIDFGMRF